MLQYLIVGPNMPPVQMFWFLLPLSLQCLLLHPTFPASLSRPLRFLLMPFSLTLAFSAPYRFAFEPRNQAVGINFVLGIMGGYGVWKGLEWGLATDLTPYAWVGFEEDEKKDGGIGSKNGSARNGTASDGRGDGGKAEANGRPPSPEEKKQERRIQKKREHSHLLTLRAKQARTEGPIHIFRSTFHLLLAMRGQGYAFCGTSTESFPTSPRPFFRRLCLEIAWSHPLLVACAAMLLEPPTSRDALVLSVLPASISSDRTACYIGEALTGLSMGVAVFSALTLGFSMATLLMFVPNVILRKILPQGLRPPPFEPREYPPLFNFAKIPSSVAVFWSKQWHSFFSRPFRFLAFDPAGRLFTPLFGKLAARTLGVVAVFALSSWIHEYGLSTATSTLHFSPNPMPSDLPFHTRWGGSIYFMSQGLAIILEGAFAAITTKRVGGPLGMLWTAIFAVGAGGFLYKGWMTQGLVREVPPATYWSWQRFVVPMGCLQPPPMWMNSLPGAYPYERHA
ncbi:hypothetical protein JCM11641_002841 [Rhodosporidiobolus odoratus]